MPCPLSFRLSAISSEITLHPPFPVPALVQFLPLTLLAQSRLFLLFSTPPLKICRAGSKQCQEPEPAVSIRPSPPGSASPPLRSRPAILFCPIRTVSPSWPCPPRPASQGPGLFKYLGLVPFLCPAPSFFFFQFKQVSFSSSPASFLFVQPTNVSGASRLLQQLAPPPSLGKIQSVCFTCSPARSSQGSVRVPAPLSASAPPHLSQTNHFGSSPRRPRPLIYSFFPPNQVSLFP